MGAKTFSKKYQVKIRRHHMLKGVIYRPYRLPDDTPTTCRRKIRGLPAISSSLPIHPNLRALGMTRDETTGHYRGSLEAGCEMLSLAICRLTEEQKAEIRDSLVGRLRKDLAEAKRKIQ